MFSDDLTLERRGAGQLTGEIGEGLTLFDFAQGGLAMAVAIRAIETELAHPELRLRTATALFASPVPTGGLTVDVSVLRRGRSLARTMHRVDRP